MSDFILGVLITISIMGEIAFGIEIWLDCRKVGERK
jgi:hypothetical protein